MSHQEYRVFISQHDTYDAEANISMKNIHKLQKTNNDTKSEIKQ